MLRLPVLLASRMVAHTATRALLCGLVLGTVVRALASHNDGSAFGLAMALVMVLCGSIAFVLHAAAVAMPAAATRAARHAAARVVISRIRGWIVILGAGIVAGIHAPTLLG